MNRRTESHRIAWSLVGFLISIMSVISIRPAMAVERHALLIGIGVYQAVPHAPRNQVSSLDGPPYDVALLQQILIERWQFRPEHIVTLVNEQATRAAILGELDRLLIRTQPADSVFVYYSGHGTSAHDQNHSIALPHTSGALIPHDFSSALSPDAQREQIIIGQRDLQPRLGRLDQGQRQVLAVFDSCYSGNAVRSLYRTLLSSAQLQPRYVSLNASAHADPSDAWQLQNIVQNLASPRYPYQDVFFIAASSDREVAGDISAKHLLAGVSTLDNKPHGAFSDALLRVLSGQVPADHNGDGLSHDELYTAVKGFMENRNFHPAHTPQRLPRQPEDSRGIAARKVFANTQPLRATFKSEPTRVRLHMTLPHADLSRRLQAIRGIEWVHDAPDLLIGQEGTQIVLIDGKGELISRLVPNDEGFATLARRIQREVWLRERLETPRVGPTLRIGLADSHQGVTLVEGEKLSLQITPQQPMTLVLLNVDSAGVIHVLYPESPREIGQVAAQQSINIPPADHKPIVVVPPFGTDHLLAVGFIEEPPLLPSLMGQAFADDNPLFQQLTLLLDRPTTALDSLRLRTIPRDTTLQDHFLKAYQRGLEQLEQHRQPHEAIKDFGHAYELAKDDRQRSMILESNARAYLAQNRAAEAAATAKNAVLLCGDQCPAQAYATRLEADQKLLEQPLDAQAIVNVLDGRSFGVRMKEVKTAPSIDLRIHFDFDSDQLNTEGHKEVAQLGQALQNLQVGAQRYRVAIIGHTDERGTEAYNQALSERRAHRVATTLTQQIPALVGLLMPSGRGKSQLLYPSKGEHRGENDTMHRLNRRVEVQLVQ